MTTLNTPPSPSGDLTLQTVTLPKDTNASGDIFGGWLMSQMDIAGAILAQRVARGRVATVSVNKMNFLRPVPVGAIVSCYCQVVNIGFSSMQIIVEVWINNPENVTTKVTEAEFIFVAIDEDGNTREVKPKKSSQTKSDG